MEGETIICFAKDWSEPPTSNHHVMIELARHNRVLWLNSVATRNPQWTSRRDLGRIARKVYEFSRGPVRVALGSMGWSRAPRHEKNGLWVFSPLVLPWPGNSAAMAANRAIVRATLQAIARQWSARDYQLWTFLPTTADYLTRGGAGEERGGERGGEHAGPSLSVYYCVDEWSLFGRVDRTAIAAAERRLCQQVDLVFAVCEELAADKRRHNPSTFVAPHGVDHRLFARALEPDTPIPADLALLPRPRVGFFGTLDAWIDLDLVRALALRRPDWSLVLIGPAMSDVSLLDRLPNVHLLGRRRHDELPGYCKGFDAAIIPYRQQERMRYVNPLKAREYLAAGLPVVSRPVPEIARISACRIAVEPDAFEAAVAAELAQDSPSARRARSLAMKDETWERRVAEVAARVMQAKEEKWGRSNG